ADRREDSHGNVETTPEKGQERGWLNNSETPLEQNTMDYDLLKAKKTADYLVQRMAPACHKIEIAGSIRRRKPLVHDIEIVAEPYVDPVANLFGEPGHYRSRLDDLLAGLLEEGVLHWFPFAKNGDRYKQFH
ncbi:hypothetical protein RZS08_37585, partial [Arthrospira platensis SPKY1]|nr:hypothetical protein [Arthrospira platensis SPKY1]